MALAAGIFADRYLSVPLPVWLAGSATSLLAWGICTRRSSPRCAMVALMVAVAAAGGGWRHWRWSIAGADHISRFAEEEPQPARLVGRIVDQPWVVPRRDSEFPSSIPRFDRTLCTIECRELASATGSQTVSGRVRLDVEGHLTHAAVGDEVEVVGQLSRPVGPRNPGAFDFRRFLRNEGLLASVHCGEPDDVQVVESHSTSLRRWQSMLRHRAEKMLGERLSSRSAPVGIALLLGTRTSIPEELRTAFAESGTMHILAISGSNVGILAGLLWGITRIIGLGRRGSVAFILAGVGGYSLIADSQPPVMRAVLMVTALLAGRPWHRDGSLVNGLALAALGVLIWNPAHLFDVGAQLSFLAVAALIWAPTWSPRVMKFAVPREHLIPGDDDAWTTQIGRWSRKQIVLLHLTMAAVWLFTLPLTMARFHLVSPVGFVVNILLSPLVVLIMWSGYALLLTGLFFPLLAPPFAWLFDSGMQLMLGIIERAAAIKAGHLYLPGPSDLWLVGFYLCLAAVAFGIPGGRWRWWGWRLMLLWSVGGLSLSLWPRQPGELRCTFLSVGHGLAVVVELPGGRTLVYDAGQMQDPVRARQTVQSALWYRGIRSIDALTISHADVDHFNGVPGLAQTMPIGTVLFHDSFLDFRQSGVEKTCDLLAQRGVPMKLVEAGDRLSLDPEVRLEVLHPPGNDRLPTDNANSLVLLIEFAGRRILLTGDLERDGLEYVLMQKQRRVDVFLAPHHGRVNANPKRLAEWADPEWVIVSDGRQDSSAQLAKVFGPECRIMSTQKFGAITFVINRDGEISCRPFVGDEPQNGP